MVAKRRKLRLFHLEKIDMLGEMIIGSALINAS